MREKHVVLTGRQLLYSCRRNVSREVSCIVNEARHTEWCWSYPGGMFDATTISRHVWKCYSTSVRCAYRDRNSPLTVLFYRQRLLRKISICKRIIVGSNSFTFQNCTPGHLPRPALVCSTVHGIKLNPATLQFNANSTFTST